MSETEKALEVVRAMVRASEAISKVDSKGAERVAEMLDSVVYDHLRKVLPPQNQFTDTQWQVLSRHYFGGIPLVQVASALNMSYDYIRTVNRTLKAVLVIGMDEVADAFDEFEESMSGGGADA